MDESDRVRDLQDRVAELKAEVSGRQKENEGGSVNMDFCTNEKCIYLTCTLIQLWNGRIMWRVCP